MSGYNHLLKKITANLERFFKDIVQREPAIEIVPQGDGFTITISSTKTDPHILNAARAMENLLGVKLDSDSGYTKGSIYIDNVDDFTKKLQDIVSRLPDDNKGSSQSLKR